MKQVPGWFLKGLARQRARLVLKQDTVRLANILKSHSSTTQGQEDTVTFTHSRWRVPRTGGCAATGNCTVGLCAGRERCAANRSENSAQGVKVASEHTQPPLPRLWGAGSKGHWAARGNTNFTSGGPAVTPASPLITLDNKPPIPRPTPPHTHTPHRQSPR